MSFHSIHKYLGAALLAGGSLVLGGCAGADVVDTETTAEADVASTEQAVQQSATASLTVTSSWADGYCASVTVTNTSSVTLTAWAVILQINPAGIQTIWNAEASIVGVPQYRQLVAQPKPYNGTLLPNASTQFGFCGLGAVASGVPAVIAAMGFD